MIEITGGVSAGRDVNMIHITNGEVVTPRQLKALLDAATSEFESDEDKDSYRSKLEQILDVAKKVGDAAAPLVKAVATILTAL